MSRRAQSTRRRAAVVLADGRGGRSAHRHRQQELAMRREPAAACGERYGFALLARRSLLGGEREAPHGVAASVRVAPCGGRQAALVRGRKPRRRLSRHALAHARRASCTRRESAWRPQATSRGGSERLSDERLSGEPVRHPTRPCPLLTVLSHVHLSRTEATTSTACKLLLSHS